MYPRSGRSIALAMDWQARLSAQMDQSSEVRTLVCERLSSFEVLHIKDPVTGLWYVEELEHPYTHKNVNEAHDSGHREVRNLRHMGFARRLFKAISIF